MASTPDAASARDDALDRRGNFQPWFYRVLRIVTAPVVRGLFRLRSSGVENIPATGGVVLAPMHRSNFDSLVVALPLPRPLRFMAKAELYRSRAMAWVLRSGGAFKVERNASDMAAVETAMRLLRAGEIVVIYPEGTRNRRGTVKPRSGAARIALATGTPVVPVAVSGTDRVRLWPPRFPRFEARYGPPLRTDDLAELEDRYAARELTNRWQEAVTAMRADLDRR
jgi:1-acyl-sn-glycerol-3-phosphate acyltransferase